MASGQQFKGDRAEAAAKLAAKDIGDINRANERNDNFDLHSEANFKQARAEAAAKLAAKDLEDVNKMRDNNATTFKEQQHYTENKPGVIGSMFRAAKEAVVGKPHDAVETCPGVYDSSRERITKEQGGSKMGEYADYATQKARETKDATVQKAGEYTDFATQKAKESKDYAADKAKEAKDATVQKASEYKDYTAEKAKEGKDSATGKLGELKDSAADAAKRAMGYFTGTRDETKVSGTAEDTRRRTQEVRVQDKDYGTGHGGEKVVIKMEESRPGAVADAMKAAERALGGEMEEEGILRVERRREKM
ncbi:hypothetical protein LR48_Vigan641s002500 [Vigna angularis]|uniref:Late embryogenesis abundant protein ECP63-like domain-containing protein n=2 Tax=Phaseolus angularis TaxID=3914 RepID=A0A0L9TFM4_PHAAN|nr:late embryogenesis abundant protein At3g53040 [Vigna angularis]KAG2406129.1 uncharacterized protein HKW66_Vig0053850 [Vigna angularis]KOM29237.1 hypothetical protein LR48_Vigan641s002500 [Vigna angularis]BAT85794.1 hypothetical protein VIGAN_04338100 [Vigna angularis var. angularis]